MLTGGCGGLAWPSLLPILALLHASGCAAWLIGNFYEMNLKIDYVKLVLYS